jgi:opacity protein-like surface antigen
MTTASAFSETTTRVGFAIGAGFEKMLSQSMSVKIEYLFMDFGSHTFLAGTGFDTNVRMIDNVIRGGVNWKF